MNDNPLKKGDKVVMHTCGESKFPQYRGKIWTCQTDSYIDKAGQEVVFLEGFSGCFICEYLAIVNLSEKEQLFDEMMENMDVEVVECEVDGEYYPRSEYTLYTDIDSDLDKKIKKYLYDGN